MSFSKRFSFILTFTAILIAAAIGTAVAAAIGTAAAEVEKAPTRDQIDDQYKWDLTDFYPSDSAWEEAFISTEALYSKMEEYKGKLGNSAETLAECLVMNDSLGSLTHRLYVYANLKLDEDNRVSKYQEMSTRVRMLYSRLDQMTSYIEPEILKIPDETLKSYIKNNDRLAVYDFYLTDLLRRKAHILSENGRTDSFRAGKHFPDDG